MPIMSGVQQGLVLGSSLFLYLQCGFMVAAACSSYGLLKFFYDWQTIELQFFLMKKLAD